MHREQQAVRVWREPPEAAALPGPPLRAVARETPASPALSILPTTLRSIRRSSSLPSTIRCSRSCPGRRSRNVGGEGLKFRQEYYACEAEDFGEVLDLDASATVLAGSYTGCFKTRDTTPLEPALKEEKYYCPGVGTVLVVDVTTQEREELERIVGP
jgi:hypothetical protein